MEINYRLGGDRKKLVKALSDITGNSAKYLGAPTFAYQVGDLYTVTRNGDLVIGDDAVSSEFEPVINELSKRGFTEPDMVELVLVSGSEKSEDDMNLGFSIGIPVSEISGAPCTDEILKRLIKIVKSKQTLFQKALGTSRELRTWLDDGTIWFDWFDEMIGEEQIKVCSEFLKGLYKMAEKSKRINSAEKPIDNEKYAMRTFLNRLGFIGDEYKQLRKTLLKNLSGSSAFRYGVKNEVSE